MRAREKAIELIDKYKPQFQDLYLDKYIIPKAKQCALIGVDEILATLDNCDLYENSLKLCVFYHDVKLEILNLNYGKRNFRSDI